MLLHELVGSGELSSVLVDGDHHVVEPLAGRFGLVSRSLYLFQSFLEARLEIVIPVDSMVALVDEPTSSRASWRASCSSLDVEERALSFSDKDLSCVPCMAVMHLS